MNRRGAAAAALAVLLTVGGGTGCSQQRDYEQAPLQDPDEVTIYTNVDQHPNLVKLCIDGVGFVTTTRDYEPVLRVPEWDEQCAAKKRS